MTDNEIIRALERCGQHRECCYCNSVEECGSKRALTASALDLINRKDAEIEKLTVNMNAYGLGMKRLSEQLETAKTEAIKEFAERLKAYSYHPMLTPSDFKVVAVRDIDNLVKEMTE